MNTLTKHVRLRDLRLFEKRIGTRETPAFSKRLVNVAWTNHLLAPWGVRGAKTVGKKKVKELPQGAVQGESLPPLESDNAPQYPAVLRGVKSDMIKFKNCIILTRVGNFYELYFEHADEYGPLLNLKVGSKFTAAGQVSMSGFPYWQLDRYLRILVQDFNKYVAISEEFATDASGKVNSGGLKFNRRVTRVVTPGTLIDEKFLDPYENNFLLSIQLNRPLEQHDLVEAPGSSKLPTDVGLAWVDVSTGDLYTQETTWSSISSAISRIGPREIIVSQELDEELVTELKTIVGLEHKLLTFHDAKDQFSRMSQWNSILETPVPKTSEDQFSGAEKEAGHRLLDYVKIRLPEFTLQLQPPQKRQLQQMMSIDRSSLKGLEILETAREGFGKGSLFHTVRKTASRSGSRLLRDRLSSPSASFPEINERLDLVSRIYESEAFQEALTQHLKRTFDVQRLVQKFALNRGDADDMLCIAKTVRETYAVSELLFKESQNDDSFNQPLQSLLARFDLSGPMEMAVKIEDAIDEIGLTQKHQLEEMETADVTSQVQEAVMAVAPEEMANLPKTVRARKTQTEPKDEDIEIAEPWTMRRIASETLERLHEDLDELGQDKAKLAMKLRDELGPTLALKWTPGLGHFCHIRTTTPASRKKLEDLHARVLSMKQTTQTFYLTDWSRLGNQIEQAKTNIRNEELRIFVQLRKLVILNLVKLRRNAALMDELDIACSFAILAREQGWVRPILNNSTNHKIIGGRHPTVTLGLAEQGRTFVSNDLFLGNPEHVWLITGPNMGGKSTFLRQNALITILAQVGAYVPAKYAEIGIVDQIFSRVGAADDLFRDQSTFMVEMLETAQILRQATPRSFVIMDEVGRGTTPEDGTAIGYACLHHLLNTNKCRTLFATHFHALADMTEKWPGIGRYCTDIIEDGAGSFSFMHKLHLGINRQSHALKVARLAGLPDSALQIASAAREQMSRRLKSLQEQGHSAEAHERTLAAATG